MFPFTIKLLFLLEFHINNLDENNKGCVDGPINILEKVEENLKD